MTFDYSLLKGKLTDSQLDQLKSYVRKEELLEEIGNPRTFPIYPVFIILRINKYLEGKYHSIYLDKVIKGDKAVVHLVR